jgi:hypothetical protein
MPKKHAPAKSSKRKVASPSKPKGDSELRQVAHRSTSATAAPAPAAKQAPSLEKSSTSARPATSHVKLPAEAALSFLRDTKGSVSWSLRDMSQTLNISREEAERVVALLQIQGYVRRESHQAGEWMTTPSGETVAGAKPPRFERETVEGALTSLRQRIEDTNKDRAAKFQITRAVAFGDFLAKDCARVQAADVGIELARKDRERSPDEIATPHSAAEAREEQHFLRLLRGRTALIDMKSYSEWMGRRTHKKLF